MSTHRIILVGGPDTGKTNFIARLWVALRFGGCALTTSGTPDEIKYVEDAVGHLHQGNFAPRTDKNLEAEQTSITIPLGLDEHNEKTIAKLVIPDISGEVWKSAVETGELPPERMAQFEGAVGAVLFVRVLSCLNVNPLDWVNAAKLMEYQGIDTEPNEMPTQVMLCELLRFIELKLQDGATGCKPRLAIVVTAWDLLDNDRSVAGPRTYLEREYPLFAGRLADLDRFDVEIFAMSIFGGDPEADKEFRNGLLDDGLNSAGYVRVYEGGTIQETSDFSFPVAWTINNYANL